METLTTAHFAGGGALESPMSGVSWGAVAGGAFVAAAMGLALLALGAGFGLAIVSPWTDVGASVSTMGTGAIIWLIVTQVISAALGGYLAGRLRTKWTALHTDEVYFRDTAHGFLVWAVALVIFASVLGTAATSLIGSSLAKPQSAASATDPNAYYVDSLFRSDTIPAEPGAAPPEAGRIFARALTQGEIGIEDRRYLATVVAARTGIAQPDAERRIDTVMANARQTADALRRVTAHVLLWTFLALLMGAFVSCYAATIGGRQRDHVKAMG